jgi:hypothetical protein
LLLIFEKPPTLLTFSGGRAGSAYQADIAGITTLTPTARVERIM